VNSRTTTRSRSRVWSSSRCGETGCPRSSSGGGFGRRKKSLSLRGDEVEPEWGWRQPRFGLARREWARDGSSKQRRSAGGRVQATKVDRNMGTWS
jgi:hypothetical protein